MTTGLIVPSVGPIVIKNEAILFKNAPIVIKNGAILLTNSSDMFNDAPIVATSGSILIKIGPDLIKFGSDLITFASKSGAFQPSPIGAGRGVLFVTSLQSGIYPGNGDGAREIREIHEKGGLCGFLRSHSGGGTRAFSHAVHFAPFRGFRGRSDPVFRLKDLRHLWAGQTVDAMGDTIFTINVRE